MQVRHEFMGSSPIPLRQGYSYEIRLDHVAESDGGVTYFWDASVAREVATLPAGEMDSSQHVAAWTAMRDLRRAGPGACCAACGHFAARHAATTCRWPESDCPCPGMTWQGFIFAMDPYAGPLYVRSVA